MRALGLRTTPLRSLLAILLWAACAPVAPSQAPSPEPPVVVLPYDAFGPQAMAHTLVGFAWWSWEGGGSYGPGDTFDVRVVVHRDGERAAAEQRWPTVPALEQDRRLVSRSEALGWLDERIAELAGEPEFQGLREELRATRARIERELPE